jgi:transcriptional regulator with XRE-family HTH domain
VRRAAAKIKRIAARARAPELADTLVGHNIRIQRIAKKMSQSELAARLGVTAQQVQKYERGANRVTAGRLLRLAGIFEVPLMTLFDGIDSLSAGSGWSPLSLLADRRALRLAQAYAQLGEGRLRSLIVDLVEELVGRGFR